MPFITDTAMQKVATKLQSFETREEKRKVEVRQKLNEAKTVAESSLGAALVGFMHGRFEDADAIFFIPRTSIPADFAMGLTGVGLAFFDMFGRADEDVLNFSSGVLSGATAMYFRKHALAGSTTAATRPRPPTTTWACCTASSRKRSSTGTSKRIPLPNARG